VREEETKEEGYGREKEEMIKRDMREIKSIDNKKLSESASGLEFNTRPTPFRT
jgi:hypothetical protein